MKTYVHLSIVEILEIRVSSEATTSRILFPMIDKKDKYASLDHGIIRNPNVISRDNISYVVPNDRKMTTNISIVEY
jgi:hypothetical protein